MNEQRKKWISGVLLIFCTYFYFLIFAQFAFLEIARTSGLSASGLKLVMGAMALGGLIGSFFVPFSRVRTDVLLRAGLAGCAVASAGAFLPESFRLVTAGLIGFSLGLLTVSLASSLQFYFSSSTWGWGAAFGTGLAYFACNVPAIFQGSPHLQTALAGGVCLVAQMFVLHSPEPKKNTPQRSLSRALPAYLLFFGVLVWLDSAVFFIIQHSQLKLGTWGETSDLWRNAFVHLVAALLGGFIARRFGFRTALWIALAVLAPASLLANSTETRAAAGWLYPAGVSIYSACLVAFPAFGPGEPKSRAIALRAALVYAICGWICSGLGIGMAENLQRVPWQFVALAAATLVAASLARRVLVYRRELAYAALVIIPAAVFATVHLPDNNPAQIDGRHVYLSEGCINCHSQYVRPNSSDDLLWGPVQDSAALQARIPPLFGNRRQGPDLLNVGNRRSRAWLRQHFVDPRSLAPGSSMPSYAYLFADGRGDALVDYLLSLGTMNMSNRIETINRWQPIASVPECKTGVRLFSLHCASCHGQRADGTGPLAAPLPRRPANLEAGPLFYAPRTLEAEYRRQRLAQIIKFGIPGTDMPGHEYFSESDVVALTLFVESLAERHR